MSRTANQRSAQAACEAAPALIDTFRLRCEAQAILVAEGELGFLEAVDSMQNMAVAYGLVDDEDDEEAQAKRDRVQQIMAQAFGRVPR